MSRELGLNERFGAAGLLKKGVDLGGDGGENGREGGFFGVGEASEDKIDVADLSAEGVVPCSEAEAGEIVGF